MKTSIKMIACSSLLWLATGCKQAEKAPQTNEQAATKAAPPVAATPQNKAMASIKDEGLQAVYQQYVKLTNALIEGKVTEAKLTSNALEAGAKQVAGGGSLAKAASQVTLASNLEQQRAYFSTLSNEMVSLIKRSGLTRGEIFVDYCPMALNDKGAYWLSSEKEIRNPYFGDVMLSCGEVTDTIQ